jgi:hypothetical protein
MSDQSFCLTVPNANCTVSAGAGAVDGFTMTTDANAFHHAGINSIIEAGADARVVAGAVFGAVAGTGVLIGTPCTIQASAGGGVQIYAGAGISPDLGGPSGPGAAFGPSEPAAFEAGAKADSLNAINDGIKGVSDVVGAGMDMADASNAFEKAKAGYEMAKGGWDTAKAFGASNETVDGAFKVGDLVMSFGGKTNAGMSGDIVGFVTGTADFLAKGGSAMAAASPAQGGAGLGNTTAATGPTCADGAAGGVLGAPGDGPRIHEVAPANIDRKCGANMTALVAGYKETKVDGKIEYTSGASIAMKAFTKVETQSLFFEAHANVTATMKGLAQVKVESMGKALVEGKATFKVATMGKGTIEANGSLDVKTAKLTVTAGQTKIGPGKVDIGPGPVTIDSVTTINKKTEIKGILQVAKKTEIKGALHVNNKIQAKGEIKGNATLKNNYFKAG